MKPGKRLHFFLSPLFGIEKGFALSQDGDYITLIRQLDGKTIRLHSSECFTSKKELCHSYIQIFRHALKH